MATEKAGKTVSQLAAAAKRAKYEVMFLQQCRAVGLGEPEREWRFHPTRKWRFDMAWPSFKTAVEIDGGVYSAGRHTRGKGFEEDCIKLAEAYDLGWTVYRFSTGQVKSGVAIAYLERALLKRVEFVKALKENEKNQK